MVPLKGSTTVLLRVNPRCNTSLKHPLSKGRKAVVAVSKAVSLRCAVVSCARRDANAVPTAANAASRCVKASVSKPIR